MKVVITMYDDKARQIFEVMMEENLIPREGQFEITDFLLNKSYEIGSVIFKKLAKPNKPSDKRFHKRMAGLNMIHLNNERSNEEKIVKKKLTLKQHSGFLYIILNSSFPDFMKIGITKDLEKRLSSYQTYDPFRNFYVKKSIFIEDVRNVEKYLLDNYKMENSYNGEWISIEQLEEINLYMNKIGT